MGIAILKTSAQADEARQALRERNLGPRLFPQGVLNTLITTIRTRRAPPRPDWSKAWDLRESLEVVESEVPSSARIADFGAFNSAIIPALIRLGYTDVVGIDLDPSLAHCPYADRVTYIVADYHRTGLPDGSCDVVTAISAIEHGFNGEKLFAEVGRVLRTGGLFIASTDYWPQKIDTSGITVFGLSWTIFSEQELRALVELAATYGLKPTGTLDYAAHERPINWSGRSYTFAHMVLRKG